MHNFSADDYKYMKLAIKMAKKAGQRDEVPVGALLVGPEGLISYGYNMRENWQTPLAHAEIIAIQKAAKKRGQWRLLDTTLYVTLEPCVMCAGALVQARVGKIVYGTKDPKGGGTESLYQICSDTRLNHQIPIHSGLMEEECRQLLKDFFKKKRLEKKTK